MRHNTLPTPELPSLREIQIAGALQSVYNSLPNRDFVPDEQQDQAIVALGEALIGGKRKGYIEMATGTGKTMLEVLLAEATAQAGYRAVLLAPTVEIANQIYGEDGTTGFGRFTDLLGKKAVSRHYGRYNAKPDANIVIMTYQGLINEMKNPSLGDFDIISADECHTSLGLVTTKAVTEYMPNAYRFGFSATPDYAEDRTSAEVYGEKLFDFSLLTAIESGKTAPVRALLYETGKRLQLTDQRKDFTDAELAPLIEEADRNGVALRLARDLVDDNRQGIIACIPGEGNSHARLMALALSEAEANGRKVIAMDIGSHLSPDENRRRLQAYKAGKIDVLTFTKSIEQGWDSDRASFCLNLAPTTSEVRIKQLLGRIMRRKPDGKEAIFIDFIDKKFGLTKHQYTAMHALEIEDIDVHRVVGKRTPYRKGSPRPRQQLTDLRELFDDDLFTQLLQGQGKLLREVLIQATENPHDPLIREWNRTLQREKPPLFEDLSWHLTLGEPLVKKLTKLDRQLAIEWGEAPSAREVLEAYPDAALLTSFGYNERVEWDDTVDALVSQKSATDEISRVEDYIDYLALRGALKAALLTLSQREAGSVRLHAGADDGTTRTLDEIGSVYGISRERVRQVLTKTYAKLAHKSRAENLEPFLRNNLPPERTVPQEEPVRLFEAIHVPLQMGTEARDYNAHLREACDTWLDESIRTANLQDEAEQRKAAEKLLPDAILVHGSIAPSRREFTRQLSEAIARLYDLADLKNMYIPLRQALAEQRLSNKDLAYLFDIHGTDPETVQEALVSHGSKPLLDLAPQWDLQIGRYTDQLRKANRQKDAEFFVDLPSNIPRLYRKDRVIENMVASKAFMHASFVRALKIARQRIINRPTRNASTAASLMVLDTQLAYYKHLTTPPPSSDDDYITI